MLLGVGLVEPLKDVRPLLLGDTDPVIAHPDPHPVIAILVHLDFNRSVAGRELDRVVDEIRDDLLQSQRVRPGS